MRWKDAARKLVIGAREGRFPGMKPSRQFKVTVVAPGVGTGAGPDGTALNVNYDGSATSVTIPRRAAKQT
jgi:alpha-D-xyloside xylohydrolase